MKSPIHKARLWFFWDEAQSQRLGPFASEEDAREALSLYTKRLGGTQTKDDGYNFMQLLVKGGRAPSIEEGR